MVPVVVMVPPSIGLVVAILVTVPDPAPPPALILVQEDPMQAFSLPVEVLMDT